MLPLEPQFHLPSPSKCKYKRQTSWVETRIIFWKQQWGKKTKSNSKKIKNKRYKSKKRFTWKNPWQTKHPMGPFHSPHFNAGRNALLLQSKREPLPQPPALTGAGTEQHLGPGHVPSPILQRINPVLDTTRTSTTAQLNKPTTPSKLLVKLNRKSFSPPTVSVYKWCLIYIINTETPT